MTFTRVTTAFSLAVALVFAAAGAHAAWAPLGSPRFGPPLVEVELDPQLPGVLYGRAVAELSPERAYLWRSEDGGATWRNRQPGLLRPTSALAIDPVDTRVLWAWTTEEGGARRGGLWRSADGGSSWERRHLAPSAIELDVEQLLPDPADPQTLYRVDRPGGSIRVAQSHDGGASFAPGAWLPHTAPYDAVAVHGQRRELIAFADGGLFASVDGGNTWQRRSTVGKRKGFVSGALAPSDPDRIYAVPGRPFVIGPVCVVRSDDAGFRWLTLATPRVPGTRALARCDAVTVDPRDEDHLWVTVFLAPRSGARFSGVSESTDGGRSWSVARRLPAFDLRLSADGEGHLWAHGDHGYGRGLYRSDDGGRSWVARHDAIVSGDAREALFAVPLAGGANRLIANGTGTHTSDDGGLGWRPLLPNRAVAGIARAGATALLAVTRGDLRLGTFELLRSPDAGVSWEASPSSPPLPLTAGALAAALVSDAVHPRYVALVGRAIQPGSGSPWLSDDGGLGWRLAEDLEGPCVPPGVSVCPRVLAYAVEPSAPARRWMSFDTFTDGSFLKPRLYLSTDGGSTWRLVSELVAATLAILVDRTTGRLLAGTDQGLMASDDSGEHWHAFGQGLPAGAGVHQLLRDGTSGPLYAATTAHGIFRSGDGGATWTRLDGEPDLDRPRLAIDGTTLLAAFRGQGVWRWSP